MNKILCLGCGQWVDDPDVKVPVGRCLVTDGCDDCYSSAAPPSQWHQFDMPESAEWRAQVIDQLSDAAGQDVWDVAYMATAVVT